MTPNDPIKVGDRFEQGPVYEVVAVAPGWRRHIVIRNVANGRTHWTSARRLLSAYRRLAKS